MSEIIAMLDRLTEIQAARDAQLADAQTAIRNVEDDLRQAAPDEMAALDYLRAGVEQINAQFNPVIEALTEQIKAATNRAGVTVHGAHLMAVYTPGRVSWDDKRLLAYAVDHNEIVSFRKVGAPSASIRTNGKSQ